LNIFLGQAGALLSSPVVSLTSSFGNLFIKVKSQKLEFSLLNYLLQYKSATQGTMGEDLLPGT